MLETTAYLTQHNLEQAGLSRASAAERAKTQAQNLYRMAQVQGRLSQWIFRIFGRNSRLQSLDDLTARSCLLNRHYAGIQTVAIRRIVGSEGRGEDFDARFRPLTAHTQARWLSIARAALLGKALPPIELIQVGKQFFVRDGHHRISVAHILGQESIEAEVTVWQITEATGQQNVKLACGPHCQPA